MSHTAIAAVIGALLPLAAQAQQSWLEDPEIQRRLAAGEVVVRSSIDTHDPRGRVLAAVRVNAGPETIWKVMTDCEHAPSFVPGLKHCRVVQSSPDGAWQIIEHEVKYSLVLPTIHYVFRADYQRPRRIDFRRVSGDIKDQEGAWQLAPTSDGSATIVQYEVYLDPGFWVPQVLVRHALRNDLPAVLRALRIQVESLQAEPVSARTSAIRTMVVRFRPSRSARSMLESASRQAQSVPPAFGRAPANTGPSLAPSGGPADLRFAPDSV